MGLDGISVNQLRIVSERTPQDVSSAIANNSEFQNKVDGLAQGQRVDPNKHNKQGSSGGFNFQNEENIEDEMPTQIETEPVIKYDLSDSSKYQLKLDEFNNQISIIEKATKNIVQVIDADALSELVSFLPNSCGSLVNKKF